MPTDTNDTTIATTEDILADFMEAMEIVASEIPGSPSVEEMLKIDAVYDHAKAKLETIMAVRELDARIDEIGHLNPETKTGYIINTESGSKQLNVHDRIADLQKQKQALLEQQG